MLLLSSCCGYKYAFGMSTFESTDVEAFPEQTDSREVVARKVLRLAIVGPPPPPRWLVPVRGGGAGVREGRKQHQTPHC